MKAQEKKQKDYIKLRFATALNKALDKSTIRSFRKLATEAGMESSHIQKISVGGLDVTLTTCIAIANALSISYTQLAREYEEVTEEHIKEYQEILEAQKRNKGKAKQPLPKSKKSRTSKKK